MSLASRRLPLYEREELAAVEAQSQIYEHLESSPADFSFAVWDNDLETVSDVDRSLLNLANAKSDEEILIRAKSLRMWLQRAVATWVDRETPGRVAKMIGDDA